MKQPLFDIKELSKKYSRRGDGFSLQDISFSIFPGETLGIIGESGSGKTTLGKLLIRLYIADSGSIEFKGKNIALFSRRDLIQYRRSVQMVFQNPTLTCNPQKRICDIISEPLDIHDIVPKSQRWNRVLELLRLVHLDSELALKYPFECSGGQLQRVSIARALALLPEVIVCDEPITALDLPTALQIIELLQALQKRLNLTYVFISHDLSMIQKISHRILVLRAGKIVEVGNTREILLNPSESYTQNFVTAAFCL